MSKILNKLFSMQIGVLFLLLFALSCAIATFIENDFGTQSAWALIYGSWWFAFIQVWLGLLVFYNMFRFKLFRADKLPSLIFHLSFLFILLGSGLTRYFGFEGVIHIREGHTENLLTSSDSFIQIKAQKDGKIYTNSKKKLFSTLGENSFDIDLDINGKKAKFEYIKLIPNAMEKVIQTKDDLPIVSLMVSDKNSKPVEFVLNKGDSEKNRKYEIHFLDKHKEQNSTSENYFFISLEDGKFYFTSNKPISWYKMSDGSKGKYPSYTKVPFLTKQLYTLEGMNIVPKALFLSGKKSWVSRTNDKHIRGRAAVVLGKLSYGKKSKEVSLIGFGQGTKGLEKKVELNDQVFTLQWGSKLYTLPFSLELIDFQLDRYPGSNSPSSYASEVKVIDKEKGVDMPYRIYMNHVLDYGGFRFFQSSYDKDEQGTILAVNQDPGKWPTYFGYTMLFLGLIFTILNPKSRFKQLARQVNQASLSKTAYLFLTIFILFFQANLQAQILPSYDKKHSDFFGTILIQSIDGRIKPIDTLSNEVLSKVYKKSSIDGQNANQILLGMLTNPSLWQKIPMIKVHEQEVKKLLGLKLDVKYASFDDFFDSEQKYKLIKHIEEAKRKKPALRDRVDKDIIKVDERLNICYYVYTGMLLKMFPQIDDKNKEWYAPNSALRYFSKDESSHIQHMLNNYFNAVNKGVSSGDWSEANKQVKIIKSYQKQYANDIIPSQSRINMELKFNHFKIFEKLTPVYIFAGFMLLMAIFLKMIIPSIGLKWVNRITLSVIFLSFIAHTIGLGMRWYISGHAPWSDSYESMIYIAWALSLSGVTFSRQSPISLALTSILSGISLFVAHLAWIDPQITNLVPVLKSYWLTIHVSVITASYGFFGLCALLGFFTLILFVVANPKKEDKRSKEIQRNITEATKINEMAMILGLVLLTIGNFLGGVWANESWGRYWGWDAKETWALISILIYAVVVHFRFIPKLNNQYSFAVASMFSYWTIIMTYFGVNFYLSGMHSYAAGDPIAIPTFVPTIALVMLILSLLAFFKRGIAKKL